MTDDYVAAAAFVMLMAAGLALLLASPVLLLFGGIGGADEGSVYDGLWKVLGVPWLGFIACAVASALLMRARRPIAACVPAALPLAALGWVGWVFVD